MACAPICKSLQLPFAQYIKNQSTLYYFNRDFYAFYNPNSTNNCLKFVTDLVNLITVDRNISAYYTNIYRNLNATKFCCSTTLRSLTSKESYLKMTSLSSPLALFLGWLLYHRISRTPCHITEYYVHPNRALHI